MNWLTTECVLSHLFCILSTNDCPSVTDIRHIVKFADETVISEHTVWPFTALLFAFAFLDQLHQEGMDLSCYPVKEFNSKNI